MDRQRNAGSVGVWALSSKASLNVGIYDPGTKAASEREEGLVEIALELPHELPGGDLGVAEADVRMNY